MLKFTHKKIISPLSLGEKLKKAREKYGLSLAIVAEKISIQQKYLEALEEDNWQILPGEVYAKNFLKKYIKFLGLDNKILRKQFEEQVKKYQIKWNDNKNLKLKKSHLIVLPKVIRQVTLGLIILIILIYLGFEFIKLLSFPKLIILYPKENFITRSSRIKILGQVDEEAKLTLNDQEIAPAEDGFFLTTLDLSQGLNIIKIEAKKRYGKSTTIYRRIIVE